LFVCEFDRRAQVAEFQIFDEFVITRESTGRPREFSGVVPVEQPADGAPFVATGADGIADFQQGGRFGMPQARGGKTASGFDVEIEAGGVNVFASVRETHRNVRFVRPLVRRKAGVAVDAEQRAASRARIGYEVGRDFVEGRGEVGYESYGRLMGNGLVFILVRQKPVAIIVAFQTCEESEQVGSEVRWHGSLRYE